MEKWLVQNSSASSVAAPTSRRRNIDLSISWVHDVGKHTTKGLLSLKAELNRQQKFLTSFRFLSMDILQRFIPFPAFFSQENYGFKTMGSLNHIQLPQKSESPSPSSAFETGATVDIEISTLVKAEAENEDNENGRLPDVVAEAKMLGEDEGLPMQETYFSIAIQVFIPFLIAGLGMVFAGLVLDRIQVSFDRTF